MIIIGVNVIKWYKFHMVKKEWRYQIMGKVSRSSIRIRYIFVALGWNICGIGDGWNWICSRYGRLFVMFCPFFFLFNVYFCVLSIFCCSLNIENIMLNHSKNYSTGNLICILQKYYCANEMEDGAKEAE